MSEIAHAPLVLLPEVAFFQEGPGLRKWQWTNSGMKVINVTNIIGDPAGTIDISNTKKFISEVEFEEKYKHFSINEGDIVLASSGNTYGKIGIISQNDLPLMMNTSVIRFRSLDNSVLDDYYLYAFLRSPQFRNQVESLVTGGAQPNFGPTHLKKMKIPLPSIQVQRRVGSILKNYHDLMQNNLRRIQLLEESARLLYREWFVHLRFPGHEHVKVVDGVPEGWERKPLGEITELHYGKALKQQDRVEGSAPVYGSSGEVGTHERGLVQGPGIVVGRKGTVGSVYWVDSDFWPIDTVYYVEPRDVSFTLFYALLHTSFVSSDAAVPGLNRKFAYSRPVLWPNSSLRAQFEEYVADISAQISNLKRQNKKLAEARDLLLPRLMNGEIAV